MFDILESLEACLVGQRVAFLHQHRASVDLFLLFKLTFDWTLYYPVTSPASVKKATGSFHVGRWNRFRFILLKISEGSLSNQQYIVDEFFSLCTPLEIKWYGRVLRRDLGLDLSFSTLLEVWPRLAGVFGVMHPVPRGKETSDGEWSRRFPVLVEPQFKGMRLLLVSCGGSTRPYNKDGRVVPEFSKLAGAFHNVLDDDVVIDGIVTSSNSTALRKLRSGDLSGGHDIQYMVFDMVGFQGFSSGVDLEILQERRVKLNKVLAGVNSSLPVSLIPERKARTSADVVRIRQQIMTSASVNHVVVKYLSAPYMAGKQPAWIEW